MRVSRNSFIKLTLLGAVLLAVLYCLQISNGYYWKYSNAHKQNVVNENHSATLDIINNNNNNNNKTYVNKFINSLDNSMTNNYNVWCIFTKVTTNSPMKRKFRIFTESLLKYSSVDIYFNVITDNDSRVIAEGIINNIILVFKKSIQVQYYDVHKLASQLEDIVSVMSPKFSSKPGTYYSDALFFLSLGLHRIASPRQKLAVMLDVDTKFRRDIKELFREFDNFGPDALFGLAPELTPVYRHVLYLYRSQNPSTQFGEACSSGGYPGYNSGVVLFNLERLRNSLEYDQIVSMDMVEHITAKYSFKGHLGDQDFYTLLGMERPELIHTVDCGWNRQLCTWWRDRGYAEVFANYSQCNSETKLWHGNCNTPIPVH
ncbi:xyloside xylosyltransferase 1 [Microplitis demolitor]|uniref:xyloside xylosyltransferase 1 n=1 Tax=Microplitis demolitor TaxID=69319 RepID=UPI0004CD181E|nr:xyloside xylosyltransferase 1 [Microplitis demolitor]